MSGGRINMESNRLMEGIWISAHPEVSDNFSIEYIIQRKGRGGVVKARDWHDGEILDVSNVHWKRDNIIFDSFMNSTKRFTINNFQLISHNKIKAKFTFTVIQDLKRLDSRSPHYNKMLFLLDNAERVDFKQDSLEGVWGATLAGDKKKIVRGYLIKRSGIVYTVAGAFLDDGEKFKISNINYQENVLMFKSYMPSTKRTGNNEFLLKSNRIIETKFTFSFREELHRVQ